MFTIVTRMLLLSFFIYSMVDVYLKKNNIVRKTLYEDPFNAVERVSLNTHNFDMAVSFTLRAGDMYDAYENPLRFYSFLYIYGTNYYDEDGKINFDLKFLSAEPCNTTRFGGDEKLYDAMSLSTFWCPESIDFDLYGS